ncbi:MAG TPA: metallophosphoesterase [Anaeromyxobacteraceae bacterium]|nr:metallophosphoesterase [Anaeromyxobacteraceae bacterium]
MALTRRDFLKGALAAAASGAALPSAAQAVDFARAERRIFWLPDLDPAHDGLRVVQLSDFHVGSQTPPERIRHAIAVAKAFEPDLTVLTGDYLCRTESGVGLIHEQLGGLPCPTAAVLGNHDHWVDARGAARALETLGYSVLRNRNTTFRLRGAPFTVIGIDDLLSGQARPREALAGAPRGSRLVLAHGPRTAEQLRKLNQPMLCLSGHTHGGQINIPGLTPFLLRAIAHEPYSRGFFRLGSVQLYVNRGVGNSALRVRLNSRPEVTLAILRRA